MPASSRHFMLCGAVMAALLLLLPGIAPAQTTIRDKVIVVGGNRDYPPYEFLDKEGNPVGYNVDLTKAIAEVMGLKVRFRLDAWVDMRRSLDSGELDMLQGMSFSEGRAKVVDFSLPHTIVNHSVFGRRGAPAVHALEDLVGKEVAFHNRGFFHDFLVQKRLDVKMVLTDTQAAALRLVALGKCDYAVVASLPGAYLIKSLRLTNVVPVTNRIVTVNYGYAVKKGNAELLAQINEGLAILKQTGQYQAIYDKWLGVLEPQTISWQQVGRYWAMAIGFLLVVLSGALLWLWAMRKQVASRTAALEREMYERKRAMEELQLRQQQLVQADKMATLGILVSGVAHEINNPNALILLNTPLVMDFVKDTEPILEEHYASHGDFTVAGLPYSRLRSAKLQTKLNDILDGAKKIRRIVEDLKGFARRDESGAVTKLDLNEVAQTAVRLVDNTIRRCTNHFRTYYSSNLPRIRGNEQRIEQVVANLVMNACQALRTQDESIVLTTWHDIERGEVVLSVRDEGMGIAPENMQHLTDPFFTTKRDRGGTGLGLSVSSNILKEHRGSVEFSSVLGHGTTVTIRLPAIFEDEEVK